MADYFGAKQPYEEYHVQFDFEKDLGSSEEIDTIDVSAVDLSDDSAATSTVTDETEQANTATAVNVWVRAGTVDYNYKITCKIVGTAGSKYELEGILPIIEK